MADRKISELTNITGADVDDANDKIAIVDASASETKAITRAELFSGVANITGVAAWGADPSYTATANTAAFRAMEKVVKDQIVDLEGKTYDVLKDNVPIGNVYKNGYFRVEDFDQGATVELPVKDTIKVNTQAITCSEYYEAWPQDKLFLFKPAGPLQQDVEQSLFVSWNTATHHAGTGMHTALVRGTPRRMGPNVERHFQSTDGSAPVGGSTWSAGQIEGQHYTIQRVVDSSNNITDHRLMSRRIYEARLGQDILVSTTSGSSLLTIEFVGSHGGDRHGLRVGDKVNFSGIFGDPVSGIPVSGELTVDSVTNQSTAVFSGRAETASGNLSDQARRPSRVEFIEPFSFAEIDVDGGSGAERLSDALASFAPSDFPNPATLFHSFGVVPGKDAAWFGVHGGSGNANGAWVLKIENLQTAPEITVFKQLSTEGVEAAIWHVAMDGKVYGSIRSQNGISYPLRGFVFDTAGDEVTLHDFPDNSFATKSIMSGDERGGKLVVAVSGTRARLDGTPGGLVDLYALIWDSVADFEANGFENARIVRVAQDNWQSDTFEGSGTSAVGVLSARVTDRGVLCIAAGHENVSTRYDRDGQPDVTVRYVYDLLAGEPSEGDWGDWSAQSCKDVPPEPVFNEFSGLVSWFNEEVTQIGRKGPIYVQYESSAGTGQHTLKFVDRAGKNVNIGHANYLVQAQATSGAPRYAIVDSKDAAGFSVRVTSDAGTLSNSDFFISVRIPKILAQI